MMDFTVPLVSSNDRKDPPAVVTISLNCSGPMFGEDGWAQKNPMNARVHAIRTFHWRSFVRRHPGGWISLAGHYPTRVNQSHSVQRRSCAWRRT